jgi:NAD(P)-dependent dehydrogenase (short-subunit alcohol dehydrogenase family)
VGTYVVSGGASGMGAATTDRLRSQGHTVITVDQRDADVVADLGSPAGRTAAVDAVTSRVDTLDGVALFAGVVGATGRAGSLLVSVNYFGSVRLFEGLRPLLEAGSPSYALALCSNSMTVQPGISSQLVDAMLAGDEDTARALADDDESVMGYGATKTALARWLRRAAPSEEWAGAGIRLNAMAPGLIETPMTAESRSDPVYGKYIDAFPVPLGRAGQPAELAELAVFLLTRASFMTGSIVLVDGGTEAQLRPDVYPTAWQS